MTTFQVHLKQRLRYVNLGLQNTYLKINPDYNLPALHHHNAINLSDVYLDFR